MDNEPQPAPRGRRPAHPAGAMGPGDAATAPPSPEPGLPPERRTPPGFDDPVPAPRYVPPGDTGG